MSRKILIIVLFLIVLIAFLLIKNDNQITNSSPKMPADEIYTDTAFSNWKTFSDNKVGFSVKYPSDWKVEESNDSMILADIAKDNSVGFQIRVYQNSVNDFDQFVLGYLETFKSEMTSHWNGTIDQISTKSANYDGINFNRTELNFERTDNEKWHLIEYIWGKETTLVAFQCGVSADKVNDFEPILDSIADSFEFFK